MKTVDPNESPGRLVQGAMDEFAHAECIRFGWWLASNCYLQGISFYLVGTMDAISMPAAHAMFLKGEGI